MHNPSGLEPDLPALGPPMAVKLWETSIARRATEDFGKGLFEGAEFRGGTFGVRRVARRDLIEIDEGHLRDPAGQVVVELLTDKRSDASAKLVADTLLDALIRGLGATQLSIIRKEDRHHVAREVEVLNLPGLLTLVSETIEIFELDFRLIALADRILPVDPMKLSIESISRFC